MHTPGKALILLNLGTPDSPQSKDVRKYLKEFLSDPRVIDIHPLVRWALLHFFILPFRPAVSARAYQSIWSEHGSPLLVHTKKLAEKVQDIVGQDVLVTFMMRYQNPSIAEVMDSLRRAGVDQITVFPLFPQYSSAASGSAAEAVLDYIRTCWNVPRIEILDEFYDEPSFIDAFGQAGRAAMTSFSFDKVLFSFHGLPERHCRKSDESQSGSHCFQSPRCCEKIEAANRRCYRAQCFATARAIAEALALAPHQWELAFQSRLGRTPWIRPYTDVRIQEMPGEGIKKLLIFSPSFVADCLETLEEIEIRAEKDFIAAGGEQLKLVPSLNSSDIWARSVISIVRKKSMILSGNL